MGPVAASIPARPALVGPRTLALTRARPLRSNTAGSLSPSRASSARRFAPVALLAWLTAWLAAWLTGACGYPDVALTPPERAPHPPAAPTAEAAETGDAPRGEFGLGTAFVVIRFGPEPVDFEEPLADAVAEALARRPDVKFHLLAVAATGGPPFGREAVLDHAEAVLRSLAALGVPPGEVFVSAVAAPAQRGDEVRLYLR